MKVCHYLHVDVWCVLPGDPGNPAAGALYLYHGVVPRQELQRVPGSLHRRHLLRGVQQLQLVRQRDVRPAALQS